MLGLVPRPPAPAPPPLRVPEIGPQHAPLARALAAHARGRTLLVAAGDDPPAVRADELVTAEWRPGRALPHDDATFDAVLAFLGASGDPDRRRVSAELVRVARPGGVVALAATGSWLRFETAYRHFFGLYDLEVIELPGTPRCGVITTTLPSA